MAGGDLCARLRRLRYHELKRGLLMGDPRRYPRSVESRDNLRKALCLVLEGEFTSPVRLFGRHGGWIEAIFRACG